MACGTPVITSPVASLPEVVGDAALLVDPRDVRALAAGIERLWSDATLRDEFRARGLARVARFSWVETARRTLALYRELARA
jgi:glycosyltransferase involved in cell wall biosynthesis